MGRGVSDSHQELAGELGKAQCLFPVFQAHTAHHLHDQHRGGLSPTATESHQEQGGLPERHRPRKACIPRLYENPAEMDAARPELGPDSPATGHPLPGPIPDSDLKELRGIGKILTFARGRGLAPVPSQNQP